MQFLRALQMNLKSVTDRRVFPIIQAQKVHPLRMNVVEIHDAFCASTTLTLPTLIYKNDILREGFI